MSVSTIFLRVARLIGDIREIGRVSEQAAANVSRVANRASKMPRYAGKSIQNTLALAERDIRLARGAVVEAKKIKTEAYQALADAQLSGEPAAIEAASNLTALANQLVNQTTRRLGQVEIGIQAAKDIHRGGGAAALIGGPLVLENQEEPVDAWDVMEALSPASPQEVLTGIVTGQPTPLINTANAGLHFLENPLSPVMDTVIEMGSEIIKEHQPTVAGNAAVRGKLVQEVTNQAAEAESAKASVWNLAEGNGSITPQNAMPQRP
ncbi:MAG: hypothetical protein K1X66_01580 [Verrucomicrobiae bacterium]|nr:hypothetical protein [Verrucomicrobiae bacterium]